MNDLQDLIEANNHAFLVGLVKKQAAQLKAVRELAENAPKMQNMGGWSPGIVVASDLLAALDVIA